MSRCERCDPVLEHPERNWDSTLDEVRTLRSGIGFNMTLWRCRDCFAMYTRSEKANPKSVIWSTGD